MSPPQEVSISYTGLFVGAKCNHKIANKAKREGDAVEGDVTEKEM